MLARCGRVQPLKSRLAFHICTDAETWARCLCSSQAPVGSVGGKNQEGLRQLVSANLNTCRTIVGEIFRGFTMAVLPFSFLVSESVGFVCRADCKS